MEDNLHISFLASLNLLVLSKLTNDPIAHSQNWPAMPTKLPLDIWKFEGKEGEDPRNHVVNFHLWCSSNSITDDTIWLQLFQFTLTGPTMKWYVDQPSASHGNFNSLDTTFPTFFQLSFHHDSCLELLVHFKQTPATHILYHIHEWYKSFSLCKS